MKSFNICVFKFSQLLESGTWRTRALDEIGCHVECRSPLFPLKVWYAVVMAPISPRPSPHVLNACYWQNKNTQPTLIIILILITMTMIINMRSIWELHWEALVGIKQKANAAKATHPNAQCRTHSTAQADVRPMQCRGKTFDCQSLLEQAFPSGAAADSWTFARRQKLGRSNRSRRGHMLQMDLIFHRNWTNNQSPFYWHFIKSQYCTVMMKSFFFQFDLKYADFRKLLLILILASPQFECLIAPSQESW